uniref:Uncharacterized protein n=1 Tax=Rhizophora mucronata TaxID=61149 RepID=A0A2P2N9W1_RHIMU
MFSNLRMHVCTNLWYGNFALSSRTTPSISLPII